MIPLVLVFWAFQPIFGVFSKLQKIEDTLVPRRVPKHVKQHVRAQIYEQEKLQKSTLRTIEHLEAFEREMMSAQGQLTDAYGSEKFDAGGIPVFYESDGFEERNRLMTQWLVSMGLGQYESVVAYLTMFEANRVRPEPIDVYHLIKMEFLLHLGVKLSKITENNLPGFLSYLLVQVLMYDKAEDQYLLRESESPDFFAQWSTLNRPLPSAFCADMVQIIIRIGKAFDPSEKYLSVRPTQIDPDFIDFSALYFNISKVQNLTEAVLQTHHASICELQREWYQVGKSIQGDFMKQLESIKRKMDSQFKDQSVEDSQDQAQGKHDVVTIMEPISAPTTLDVPCTMPVVAEPRPTHEEIVEKSKANKQKRLQSKEQRAKQKHQAHLAKIQDVTEDDDKDITLYYSTRNAGANRVYRQNQDAQVCKMAFAKADRFQHSIYPDITASGETINFLCSLLVSGTPTYEGFLAAHKDLGGVFVEKKNGNKLFFFNEPISYHKTLHAPHLSSRFDHVLYRRFYRNCALHPYFFKLQA